MYSELINGIIKKYRACVGLVPDVLTGQQIRAYLKWEFYPGIMEQDNTHVSGTERGISILIGNYNSLFQNIFLLLNFFYYL